MISYLGQADARGPKGRNEPYGQVISQGRRTGSPPRTACEVGFHETSSSVAPSMVANRIAEACRAAARRRVTSSRVEHTVEAIITGTDFNQSPVFHQLKAPSAAPLVAVAEGLLHVMHRHESSSSAAQSERKADIASYNLQFSFWELVINSAIRLQSSDADHLWVIRNPQLDHSSFVFVL
ncbi:unnamed protein product [Boreogadus saida]